MNSIQLFLGAFLGRVSTCAVLGRMFLDNDNISSLISNIKISTMICIDDMEDYEDLADSLAEHEGFQKKYRNFLVIRSEYCYILFCNGHVNVTGIREESDINWVLFELAQIFGRYVIGNPRYTIDNISASYNTRTPFNLTHLSGFGRVPNVCHITSGQVSIPSRHALERRCGISYEPELFPAVKITTWNGTCLLFASGKANFIGVRSLEGLKWMVDRVELLRASYISFEAFRHKLESDESIKLYMEMLLDKKSGESVDLEYDIIDFLF